MRPVAIALFLLSTLSFAQSSADSLNQLASDFWTWRAKYRPFTFDDVPRMEHAGGVRDWSGAAITSQRADLSNFERRLKAMTTNTWPVPKQVDYRLMGSALARARWELDVDPRWQRDPVFYVEQTVVALQEELMPPPPFSEERSREIVVRAENIPPSWNRQRPISSPSGRAHSLPSTPSSTLMRDCHAWRMAWRHY